MPDEPETFRLPEDPDPEAIAPDRRPLHVRGSSIVLVFLGGTVGTAVREAMALAFPPIDAIPYTIGAINLVGAFLLGCLLEGLVRRGPDVVGRQRLRLLLGTGFLGGFTTYSALAVEVASLAGAGRPGAAAAYGLVTVLPGVAASYAGVALATARHPGSGRAATATGGPR